MLNIKKPLFYQAINILNKIIVYIYDKHNTANEIEKIIEISITEMNVI